MAKKEVKTDLWVAKQLDECNIRYDAQGSNTKEIDEALKSASKRGTGKAGYPEYVAVIGDFVLVIEDKAALDKHINLTDRGVVDTAVKSVTDYAVNGAYFYAKHIAQNSTFKKVFAVGVSGDEKHHKITPLWVDDREGYKQLPDIESFVWFSPSNINEYYTRYVLEEATDVEKTTEQILKDAAELHEYLRTYGTLKDQDKPLVGAGKRLETRNKIPGTRPFIGATDNGNGVTGFVGNDNASKDSNVLGVNYNGAPCIAFYHPYECIFTDDVKRLHLRNYKNNKFVLLFFASLFAQQRSKYSYGYKFKEKRMLRQKLMLPVDDAGEPDYAYMEQYSKNMMLRKYKQYLEFINRQNVTEVD